MSDTTRRTALSLQILVSTVSTVTATATAAVTAAAAAAQKETIVACCALLISCLYLYFRLRHRHRHRQQLAPSPLPSPLPSPYTCFGHPHKCLADKLLGIIFPLLLPVAQLANHTCTFTNTNTCKVSDDANDNRNDNAPNNNESQRKLKKILTKVRNQMSNSDAKTFTTECKSWNELLQIRSQHSHSSKNNNNDCGDDDDCNDDDYLVGGTVLVQRDADILSKWGIIDADASAEADADADAGHIEVEMVCPSTVITNLNQHRHQHQIDDPKEKLKEKHGYKVIPTCNLEELILSPKADILIYFHGGGMTLGQAKDSMGVASINALLRKKMEEDNNNPDFKGGTSTSTSTGTGTTKTAKSTKSPPSPPPPIIFLSVNYRLSPEHTFPSAIIDGLSVSASIIEHCCPSSKESKESNNIHFAGISAGGNLSAVVGLETYRRYSSDSRIKSLVTMDPMLLPETKTMSYHLNSRHSPLCPVEFLRWCWGCYLGFQPSDPNENAKSNPKHSNPDEINFHSLESYTKALRKCIFYTHVHVDKGRIIPTDDNNNKNRNSSNNNNNNNNRATSTINLRRLVSPQIDLPPNLGGATAPTIIVTTSKGDPLRDDGIDLFQKLERVARGAGADVGDQLTTTTTKTKTKTKTNILHFEGIGSHAISFLFDTKEKERFYGAWKDAFWG